MMQQRPALGNAVLDEQTVSHPSGLQFKVTHYRAGHNASNGGLRSHSEVLFVGHPQIRNHGGLGSGGSRENSVSPLESQTSPVNQRQHLVNQASTFENAKANG